jgi:CxxC-x17-CxxC domain-containing protein
VKEDKVLTCRDCGAEFVFSASEQEFYEAKGFANEPGRCPGCRAARKQRNGGERAPRQMYSAVCAECGIDTEVPFRPSMDRPVYCRDCFTRHSNNG